MLMIPKVELLKLGLLNFFERNNLATAMGPEIIQLFSLARQDSDVVVMSELIRRFPALRYLLEQRPCDLCRSPKEVWEMTDEQFCVFAQYAVVSQGIANHPETQLYALEYLLHWSDLRSGDVADIGCGSCHLMIYLKKMQQIAGRCFGVDASLPNLEMASQLASRESSEVRFIKSICFALPFVDGSLSQVWALMLLPWVVKWQETILEFRRVLKLKGRIILAHRINNQRTRVDAPTIVGFLKDNGFCVDDVTTYGPGTLIAAGKR